MALLDVSIVFVATPSMERDLHASSAQIEWVMAGYSLAFALALISGGRLGAYVFTVDKVTLDTNFIQALP